MGDKLGIPKWSNTIPTMVPDAPDADTVAVLCNVIAQRHRAILLFANHASFKAWQRKLAEVLV